MSADPDQFFDDLETVIYGCHATSREQIRGIFEDEGLYTFTFAEYFLDEPVTKKTATLSRLKNRRLYFPFLPWAASLLLFRLDTSEEGTSKRIETKFKAKTREWREQLRQSCRTGTELKNLDSQLERIPKYFSGIPVAQDPPITDKTDILSKRKEAAKLATPGDPVNEGMVSYEIQIHLWTQSDVSVAKPVIILRIPIMTALTYYGHLLVAYQQQKDGELAKRLENELAQLAKERYTPTLTLLHFSKWERALKAHLDKSRNTTLAGRTSVTPGSLNWKDSTDNLERAFGNLWEQRETTLGADRTKRKITAKSKIKNSIILDEYHIASPTMVEQVKKVVRGASLMSATGKKKKSLPSALIFGEAGSGKDHMARLIPTLTKDFWEIEPITQNMAAIKPSLFAVPLMFGIDHRAFSAPGIFRHISEKSKRNSEPQKQVLILDELNSLDYDMQGSLLRLIENNEAAPLFGKGSPMPVNALVIGIVNEDPERVTREEELRLLEGAREFLGRAEAARLYEALHKARRLRPDLVHRLRRGIYVRMPSLRDRREDIPLLFSRTCAGPIKDLASQAGKNAVQVVCDLEAFDLLMRRDLPWPGNIRQLQTVASKVANAVWDDFSKEKNPSKMKVGGVDHEIVPVRRNHVEKALHAEFRKQNGKPDDRPD